MKMVKKKVGKDEIGSLASLIELRGKRMKENKEKKGLTSVGGYFLIIIIIKTLSQLCWGWLH